MRRFQFIPGEQSRIIAKKESEIGNLYCVGTGASCLIQGFNPISDQFVGLNTIVSSDITREILVEELPSAYRDQVDSSQTFTKVELQYRTESGETVQETIYPEGDYDRERLDSCFTSISELDVSKLPEIVARALQSVEFSSATTITSSPTTTVQTTPTTTVTTSQTTSKTSTPTTTVRTSPTTTVTSSQTTSKTTTQTTTVSASPTTSASSSPSTTITTSPTTSKTTTQTTSESSSQTSTVTTTKSSTVTTTVTRTQTSTPSTSQTSTQTSSKSTSPSSTVTTSPTTTVTTTVTKTVTTTVTTSQTATPSSTQIVSDESNVDQAVMALIISFSVVSIAMCIMFVIWKMNKPREIDAFDSELESGVDINSESDWIQPIEALDSQEMSTQKPNEEPGFIEKKRIDPLQLNIEGLSNAETSV